MKHLIFAALIALGMLAPAYAEAGDRGWNNKHNHHHGHRNPHYKAHKMHNKHFDRHMHHLNRYHYRQPQVVYVYPRGYNYHHRRPYYQTYRSGNVYFGFNF